MEQIKLNQIVRTPNWRWIVTAYCFFILFHLLPFFLLSNLYILFIGSKFWAKPVFTVIVLMFTSTYLSYRSRSVLFLEPAITAILYIFTLHLLFPSYLAVPIYLQNMYFMIECSIFVFIFAIIGAGIGFWFKRKYQIQ
jgi:hypothetical protein